ncbi:MAG: PQQ-binding-like beta-propeller repeat protein [Streptosporangiales bacterium]|nr:PQQ-binding-like beta-propeller repeat protein [Streptosporangiales bacterium]
MEPLRSGDPGSVGGYRLLGRLGAGGMGIVYLGRSRGGRLVAVKVVREHFARDSTYRARFQREVVTARRVTGTFTAPLLDADPGAPVPWLAMDYLPGLSLREAVETFGPFPPATVRLLAAALAEALADIHGAGLAHRDLKPGNVVLTAGGPRVIDFGIARPEHATAITMPGARPGTAGFMSPEQASGDLAGPAGDVFALGAVLVYAATGKEPFAAEGRAATLARVRLVHADLEGLTDRRLRSLVTQCLRREPGQRPAAAALLDRLGEPEASVQGTRWLPAPLAEAIDARAAHTVPPMRAEPTGPAPAGPGALANVSTADPGPVFQGPTVPGPGWPRQLGRRKLLMAGAGVAAAAVATVAARPVLSAINEPEPSAAPPTPGRRSPTTPPKPPQAAGVWREELRGKASSNAGPIDLYTAGGVVLAARGGGQSDVNALDPRTGKILWTRTPGIGPVDRVTAGPDMAYVPDDKPDGDTDTVIRALNPVTGKTRWTYRLSFEFPWGVAAAGPLVYVPVGDEVRALDADNGRRRWTARATAMSIRAGTELVVAGGERRIAALDAGSGRVLWTKKLEESPHYPMIGDGLIFAADTFGVLYAYRAENGKTAWRKELDYRTPVRHIGAGMIFVDEQDGTVRALAAETGKPVWSRRLGGSGQFPAGDSSVLGFSGDTLWVGANDQVVYGLAPADGRVLWTYEANATGGGSDAETGAGAVAVAGLVVLATGDGYVEAVRPPTRPNGGPRAAD